MNRSDKERKVQREDGKVFEIRGLSVSSRYLSGDYEYRAGEGKLTPTGHLIVFELVSISQNLPSFIARWDGGSREPGKQERYELDVDMVGGSQDEREDFKRGRPGYCGHHTKPTPDERGRTYEVLIKTPDGTIFDGIVSFAVHRRMALIAESRSSASLQMRKISGAGAGG